MQLAELIQKVVANNHIGVYYNLVKEGVMSPGLNPDINQVLNALLFELQKSTINADFIIKVMDVPVNTAGLYAQELNSLTVTVGKTPGMLIADQVTAAVDQTPFERVEDTIRSIPGYSYIFTILAMIGLVVLIRFVVRMIVKIAE